MSALVVGKLSDFHVILSKNLKSNQIKCEAARTKQQEIGRLTNSSRFFSRLVVIKMSRKKKSTNTVLGITLTLLAALYS